MKKNLILSFCLLVTGQVIFAQQTITNNNAYYPGDTYSIQEVESDLIEPSAAGANVNVDFSDVISVGSPVTTNLVSPSSTPYASTFPTATVAAAVSSAGGVSAYAYFNTGSGQMESVGVGSSQFIMTYDNPMIQLKYPMSYGDSIFDEHTASYSANGVDVKRYGQVAMKADAYGNITTPSGTFPYIRLYVVQLLTDSFFLGDELISLAYSETYTYGYFNNQFKAPLFNYSEVWTSAGTNFGAYYNTATGPTGVAENQLAIANEVLYPNPVSINESLLLSFELKSSETMSLSIVDMQGKVVQTLSDKTFAKGKHQLPLDINSLSAGLYYVAMNSKSNATRTLKFIVQ